MPTAFITGATAGIGAAFARRLASDGFDLVLLARDAPRLEGAADELRDRYGVRAEVLAADLSTDDGIAAAADRAARDVDLVINNAGFGVGGTFLNVPADDEATMLKVHCEAVLRITHAALPPMLERRRGGIVNVSSVSAFLTRGSYGASKSWVIAFSRGVRSDVFARGGRNVRVMALAPGFVRTEFHRRAGMKVDGIPEFLWLPQDLVVSEALRDLRRGRAVSVPSPQYKAVAALARLMPPDLMARFSARTGRDYD